jgi:hypothetical protein
MFSKVPTVNKKKDPKKGERGTRWKDPSYDKTKKPPMLVDHKENMKKSSIENPQLQKTY